MDIGTQRTVEWPPVDASPSPNGKPRRLPDAEGLRSLVQARVSPLAIARRYQVSRPAVHYALANIRLVKPPLRNPRAGERKLPVSDVEFLVMLGKLGIKGVMEHYRVTRGAVFNRRKIIERHVEHREAMDRAEARL